MRILFAGTPLFAVYSLQSVSKYFNIVGVLTAPDKPSGRGKRLHFSSVKIKALELSLLVYQPEKIDNEFIKTIIDLKPDLLVVVAYGKIFKKNFIDIFPRGGLNLHPSLLPLLRGPAPIPAAIKSGEPKTGITIQELAIKMDSGDILYQEKIALSGLETTESLSLLCAEIGAQKIIPIIKKKEEGNTKGIAQKEEDATFCKLIKKEDGEINWDKSARKLEREIRAYTPWPKSYTYFKGLKLFIIHATLLELEKEESIKQNGCVIGIDKKYGILVKTSEGILGILKLQLQSKKQMDWRSFLNGHKDILNTVLGVEKHAENIR